MDIDLQQYSDEWFDIINVPIGKEFELPNISNTMNHQLIYTINKVQEDSFENPISETELVVSCSTEIHLASTPTIRSVGNVKTKNKQVCEPNPLLQTPKGINQQPNFCTTFNSSQVCPNKSKHMTNQAIHFQGLRKPPLPCLKVGPVTKQENPNSSTHKVNQFSIMSNVGPQSSSCTNGSLTNNQFNFPLLDPKREPLVLPENNSPPLLVPKRAPLVLPTNDSPPMLVPKQEPQVLPENDSHPMLVPKQEPQVLPENHPPPVLVPKQEPQILPENDPPPVLIPKQEPQFFPENDPPLVLVRNHEPQVLPENDSHPMLVPKQEPQVCAENNSPPLSVPKQEPQVLLENNSPPLLVPKQEPQVHPENNSPQVNMDSQNHSSHVLGSTMKPNSSKSVLGSKIFQVLVPTIIASVTKYSMAALANVREDQRI
nr:hypothetical protein CFP56_74226 [Quercus suber]